MRKSGALTRGIVIALMIMVLCILGLSTVVAQDNGGPLTIAGRVYDSGGDFPGDGHEGADAAVIVEHDGVRTTYKAVIGLEQAIDGTYWYNVTIPQGAWEIGDTFWVKVDGSGWGDEDFTCTDHDDNSITSWTIENAGGIQQDVDTNGSNLKPLIAWIFAIILVVVGVVVGLIKPLKVPASGWPRQPADITDDLLIGGVAEMPAEGIVMPEAAAATAAPAEEEHVCATCGGAYKYIPEYDSWYCDTCQKYEEAPAEEPPAEETAEEPPPEPECKTCQGKLEFIEKYDRWFCRTCAKYAEPEDVAPPEPEEAAPPEPKEPPESESPPPPPDMPPEGGV